MVEDVVNVGDAVTIGVVDTVEDTVIGMGVVVTGLRIASGSHIRPALLKKATSVM